jgi:hypothetical protein
MSQVFTGVTAVISGSNDIAVLAEIISSVDYETLKEMNKGRPLTITQEQFELFIARNGRAFMDSGLLGDELEPTGNFVTALQ